jgi:hypothetical protein
MELRNLILAGTLSALAAACTTDSSGGAAAGSSSAARGAVPLQSNQTRQQLFGQLDANANNAISQGEAQASPALVVIFVEMDANSDGELNAAEFSQVPLVNPDGTRAQ